MKNRFIYTALLLVACATGLHGLNGQPVERSIVVRGEVRQGSVSLRWAATDARTWQRLNRHGVRLERLTLARGGAVLDDPETVVLAECLRPEETQELMQAAETFPFAAVIAQAVFGESFELTGGESEIARIIAQGEELQQRYVLSLYAADLCFPGALAARWGWNDYTVREDERYLYRAVPLVPDGETAIETGALFVDPARYDRLPKPLDFRVQFGDGSALLSWDYRILERQYIAYVLERSTDGKRFEAVSDTPITQMTPSTSGQLVHMDEIANGVKYYYRLTGVTPFDTRSPYSDVVSGIAIGEPASPPLITRAIPDENGGVNIEWMFDTQDEALITGFALERSDDDKRYGDLITDIARNRRHITVRDAAPTNYYVIRANTLSGRRLRSFPVLVQPIDTIPPPVPEGLRAVIDTTGAVHISWLPNKDSDTHGYRLYKGNTAEEELVPMNDDAITATQLVDSVSLRMLNANVYYAIAALDERYNESDRSAVIAVEKPETIPPTAPLIRRIDVENGRNVLTWVSGGEERLAGYDIYRRSEGDEQPVLLAGVQGAATLTYEDDDVENNTRYVYHVCSRTAALVSDLSPAYPVTAIRKDTAAKSKTDLILTPHKDRVQLQFRNIPADVISVQLYRREADGALELYRDVLPSETLMDDPNVIPGVAYEYLLVVKTNGSAPIAITKKIKL